MTDSSLYSMKVRSLEGDEYDLRGLHGKVALVVNVASECGYTPQYEGLQRLHEELSGRGLCVLGFPSDDFGGQEPGTAEEIRAFCNSRYGVDFALFEKVHTKAGRGQSPVYALLAEQAGQLPAWNFGKYLVSKEGRVLRYFDSSVEPESPELRAAIEDALGN